METTDEIRRKTLLRLGLLAGAAAVGQGLSSCKDEDDPKPSAQDKSLTWGSFPTVLNYVNSFSLAIKWEAKNLGQLQLAYRRAGETEYNTIATFPASSGEYVWNFTGSLSDVTLRLSEENGSLNITKELQFRKSSLAWGVMQVIFPYSTEFVYTIRWEAQYVDQVILSYRKEGETAFTQLATLAASAGRYDWVLTGLLEEVTLRLSTSDGSLMIEKEVKFQRLSGEMINIQNYPTLLQVGGVSIVQNNATGDLFIRRTTLAEFIVVAAWCTHAGCMVEDNPGQGIICNCHGSTFTQTGQVTQGPAMFDLQLFQSTFYPEQNKLIVVP